MKTTTNFAAAAAVATVEGVKKTLLFDRNGVKINIVDSTVLLTGVN